MDSFKQLKDGGICADSESKRSNGDKSNAGLRRSKRRPIPQVLQEFSSAADTFMLSPG
jgi:hypothetical protein